MKSIGSIGAVQISRVLDSTLLGETMQGWFPDFNCEEVKPHESWLCPHHYNSESGHFSMPVHSWVLRINGYTVLIDTCIGNHKHRPGLFEMHMLNTRYLERMSDLGVRPEDVDFVLCTHLHVDHVGWNTRLEGGKWVPTFPNAQYVISRTDYEAAKADALDPGARPFLKDVFEDAIYPIVESGQACVVDGVYELLDHLTLTPAPGHSPGNYRIELRSQGQTGVFAGDILHSPVQIPFWRWSSRVCRDRMMAAESRRKLLEFCVSENALLLPGHFEAPHVGRIRNSGDTFAIDFGW